MILWFFPFFFFYGDSLFRSRLVALVFVHFFLFNFLCTTGNEKDVEVIKGGKREKQLTYVLCI
jgi:hypothetical protein